MNLYNIKIYRTYYTIKHYNKTLPELLQILYTTEFILFEVSNA